ncbi:hypothetical protein [Streptomyces sp. NRRL S-350]|uniref:hypothetical protein n=1 Tax=Streptomyces sp. NRRL S-350 TaxID=1463902 RepID=UPI0004C0615E|nr:hypothetical protein [Streptomyces sp. NRRL S-350]
MNPTAITLPGRLHAYLLAHPDAITDPGLADLMRGAEVRPRGVGTAAYIDTTPDVALRLADQLDSLDARIAAGTFPPVPIDRGSLGIVAGKMRRAAAKGTPRKPKGPRQSARAAEPSAVYHEAVRMLVRAAADYLRAETGLPLPAVPDEREYLRIVTLAVETPHSSGTIRIDLSDLVHCCTLTFDRIPLDRAAQAYRAAWGDPHDHFDGGETLEGFPPGEKFEFEDANNGERRTYGTVLVEVLDEGLARLELPDFSLGDVALALACLTSD